MEKNVSPGRPFINAINQARAAVVSAAARGEQRGIHIAQAVHLLRTNVMSCARAVMAPCVTDRLAALCEYMCARLSYADVQGVDAPFTEVIRLLDDLRQASPSLDRTPSAKPASANHSIGTPHAS